MNTVIRISIFTLFYSEYRECTEKKITKDFWVTFRCIVMFITSTFISRLHTQQFHINKPTFNRHSNRHFCVNEKKSPKGLLSPQIILFFIVGSPVDDPTVLKIGVQWGYKSHPHSLKALILSLFSQKYGFWANYCILLQVYSYNSIKKCSCNARFT